MVGALVNKRKASRDSIILRLSMLGWTYQEIADRMRLKLPGVQSIYEKFNIKEIINSFQQGKTIPELATYYNLDQTLTWAIDAFNYSVANASYVHFDVTE